jgi:hypothetical protein
MKIYRTGIDSAKFMEYPCRCDCGYWFDLDDGFANDYGKLVCQKCHQRNEKISDLENEIESLEMESNTKRKIKALRKQIEELKNDQP